MRLPEPAGCASTGTATPVATSKAASTTSPTSHFLLNQLLFTTIASFLVHVYSVMVWCEGSVMTWRSGAVLDGDLEAEAWSLII